MTNIEKVKALGYNFQKRDTVGAINIINPAGDKKVHGFSEKAIEVVSCPTCGRTKIEVASIAQRVEKEFENLDKPIKIAIVGCVVNGPGEAKGADIALCGGDQCGALYIHGEYVRKLTGDLAVEMISAIKEYLDHDIK